MAVIAALPVVEIMLFMTVGVWLGLWLTLGLYTVFIVLSVVGWRAWRSTRG